MRLPFKRSKTTDRPAVAGDDAQALDAARTQARRRLIGALVLLVIAVVGFPLLFETQPRPASGPVAVDAGELVLKGDAAQTAVANTTSANAAAALNTPAVSDATSKAVATAADVAATGAVDLAIARTDARTDAKTDARVDAKTDAKAESTIETKVASKAEAPAAPRAESKPAPAKAEQTKTEQAKTETAKPETGKPEPAKPAPTKPAPAKAETPPPPPAAKTAEPAASGERWVVQVGAYSELARMNYTRKKVEGMGFKTYTSEVTTPSGKRTRLRLGPFPNKAQAEAAAAKLKAAGMVSDVLSL